MDQNSRHQVGATLSFSRLIGAFELTPAIISSAAILGGAGALTLFNNRETRGSLSAFEASFLNQTFTYVGAGLSITAASAYALHRTGASFRIMRANPWLIMGVSLVASIGSMYGALSTPPEQAGKKHFWWIAFNLAQSATLSPLL